MSRDLAVRHIKTEYGSIDPEPWIRQQHKLADDVPLTDEHYAVYCTVLGLDEDPKMKADVVEEEPDDGYEEEVDIGAQMKALSLKRHNAKGTREQFDANDQYFASCLKETGKYVTGPRNKKEIELIDRITMALPIIDL